MARTPALRLRSTSFAHAILCVGHDPRGISGHEQEINGSLAVSDHEPAGRIDRWIGKTPVLVEQDRRPEITAWDRCPKRIAVGVRPRQQLGDVCFCDLADRTGERAVPDVLAVAGDHGTPAFPAIRHFS